MRRSRWFHELDFGLVDADDAVRQDDLGCSTQY
jgi:hypothetical protein